MATSKRRQPSVTDVVALLLESLGKKCVTVRQLPSVRITAGS